jgi:hypothetical protein
MKVLECHQLTPPNKMVQLNPQAVPEKKGLNSWLKFKLESFLWIKLKFKSEYYLGINC